jgi:uncharacterized membrane protein
MEEIDRVTTTTTEQVTPGGTVVQKNVTTAGTDSGEFLLRKVNDIVWLFIGLIMLLLVVRVIFLLLGANNTGIVSTIYQISGVFIAPFVGIFQSPSYGSSFFDMAAVVGLVFYAILGFVITSVLSLFSKRA